VKGVVRVKWVGIEFKLRECGMYAQQSAGCWKLDVWWDSKVLFSLQGETKEAVLKKLSDIVAELTELQRLADVAMRKAEDMAEELERV
jgi:hypothetical protein